MNKYSVALVSILIGGVAFWFIQNIKPENRGNLVSGGNLGEEYQLISSQQLHPLTIQSLREQNFPGSDLVIEQILDGIPRTLEEIGRILGGISRERIRQVEAKALKILRAPAITAQLEGYLSLDGDRPAVMFGSE